jgi:hypothetical protein
LKDFSNVNRQPFIYTGSSFKVSTKDEKYLKKKICVYCVCTGFSFPKQHSIAIYTEFRLNLVLARNLRLKVYGKRWAWWYTTIIQLFRRQMQKDCEFEAIWGKHNSKTLSQKQ